MATETIVTDALNEKIAELEREHRDLQRHVQRLAEVTANLAALRKTLSLMSSRGTANAASNGASADTETVPGRRPVRPGTVGFVVIEILREAGKPQHIKELLPKVRANGKPDVTLATLNSTLCDYANAGKLRRTKPSTYALPNEDANKAAP